MKSLSRVLKRSSTLSAVIACLGEQNNSNEDVVESHASEITKTQKTVTFSSTEIKTMESYTEKFHAEYVVEQAILESNLKDALSNGNGECHVPKPENEENITVCQLKPSNEVKEEAVAQDEDPKPVDNPEENVCFVQKEEKVEVEATVSSSESDKTPVAEVTGNGHLPSAEKLAEDCRELGSLYPKVVVKSEPGEMIECKDLNQHRKGSRQSISSLGTGSRKGSLAFVPEKDIDTILADVKATLTAVEGTLFEKDAEQLRVAVIGAGPAGLCAARHLLSEGIEAEVFEQCADIGGTWVYTEQAHSGTHVFPLHSSLYHDLWTNLPKETMQYPDFPYREEGHSYLPSEKVLQYLVDYADHFNLHPIIKVRHQVKTVAPLGNYWSVTIEDLARKQEVVSHFDAVMVCSGPNTIPVYPTIDGLAKFSGKQLHSRDYRRADTYTGKTVLIVGLGPSGLDITYQLQPTAKKVFLSHNRTKDLSITFPEGVIVKPKVKSLFDKTVTFEDDTEEDVDVIIYCTGYTYNFPFLTEECGLIVDQNVSPLYKHLVNIEHPTMCIVGLPKYCPHQYMVDYQVRAFLNILLGRSALPEREEMLSDVESDRNQRLSEGQRQKDFHKLGKERTKGYMDDLTTLGKLNPVPPVMYKLFFEAFIRAIRDFKGFRKYNYKIVDNDNFAVEALEERATEGKGERTID